jgi:hypothetical protein
MGDQIGKHGDETEREVTELRRRVRLALFA